MKLRSSLIFPVLNLVAVLVAGLPGTSAGSATSLDALAESAVQRSEELLYAADLDAALEELRSDQFDGAEPLPERCRVALAVQTAKILIFKSTLEGTPERYPQILADLLELSSAAEGLADQEVRARYLFALGGALLHGRQRSSAGESYSAAADLFAQIGDSRQSATARAFVVLVEYLKGRAAGDAGKIVELIPDYEAEMEFSTQVGNGLALAYNLRHLGRIYLDTLDEPRKALDFYRRSLAVREEIGFRPLLPASYFSVGDIYGRLGRIDEAREMLLKSAELADEIGFARYRFLPRIELGELSEASGAVEEAGRLYREALRAASEDGNEAGAEQARLKLREIETR